MPVPDLTDDDIFTLLDRAAASPEGREAGLTALSQYDEALPWRHAFVIDGYGDRQGEYSRGDAVWPDNFRTALKHVIAERGNHQGRQDIADAYWAAIRTPAAQWSPRTVIAIATLAPLLHVLENWDA